MITYRFIYSVYDHSTGTCKSENTAFLAEDETQAQVLVEAYARLLLGRIYYPNCIALEWGENYIYAATKTNQKLNAGIPILAGEIHLESDILQESENSTPVENHDETDENLEAKLKNMSPEEARR